MLKALGATSRQIVTLFLTEAALLSSFGAVIGLGIGFAGGLVVTRLYPVLQMTPPLWAVIAAAGLAVAAGLVFGILPARRAAQLDPVMALARH